MQGAIPLAPPELLPSRREATAGAEGRAALDALGKSAASHQQLALGVCSSADPLWWRLALQEGGRKDFSMSQDEPGARGGAGARG